MKSVIFKTGILLLLLSTLSACFAGAGPAPEKKRTTFAVAYRALPPEPVYGRLSMVRLPEPAPSAEMPVSDSPRMLPVMHLELKNVTMSEAAQALAETARYRSYCDPNLASRRVSFNSLGTIDELAQNLARSNSVSVSVDHANREVKVLAYQVKPQLLTTEVSANEHNQPHN